MFSLKNKKVKLAVLFILIISVLFSFFGVFINPVLISTIRLKSMSLTTKAINSAIAEVVMNSIVYDDLINIITDEKGNISMIQANSLEINNLSKDLAQTTESTIEQYGSNGISVPLGLFTGISLLVGVGPKVNIRLTPIGAVTCVFNSQFTSAGINQTIHKIYVNVNANVGIVLPLYSTKYLIDQQVLIAESIIVGNVPEVYYQGQLDKTLNFVPS